MSTREGRLGVGYPQGQALEVPEQDGEGMWSSSTTWTLGEGFSSLLGHWVTLDKSLTLSEPQFPQNQEIGFHDF